MRVTQSQREFMVAINDKCIELWSHPVIYDDEDSKLLSYIGRKRLPDGLSWPEFMDLAEGIEFVRIHFCVKVLLSRFDEIIALQ